VLFDAPHVDELRTFVGLMRVLEDRPVWVHCAMDLRVSAFLYHYRRHDLGLSEEQAHSPVLARWEPRMDAVWREFLIRESSGIRFLREWTQGRRRRGRARPADQRCDSQSASVASSSATRSRSGCVARSTSSIVKRGVMCWGQFQSNPATRTTNALSTTAG